MSDDDFEESLRDALRESVPAPPTAIGRTAGARSHARRARRTRVLAAAGAVAVVIAAAVTVPSVLASTGGTTGDASRPHLRMPVAHPFTCPATTPGNVLGVSFFHGRVPTNAVLARVCPLGAAAGTHAYWTAPADPLVTDVPALVSQLNALPVTRHAWCPKTSQPAYSLTFQYRNGQTTTVLGETGGCDVVNVVGPLRESGPETTLRRTGATALLRDYLTGLAKQRSTYQPSAAPATRPSCPPGLELGSMVSRQSQADQVTSILADVAHPELLSAVECAYSVLPGRVKLVEAGALSSADVREMDADLAAHATQDRPGREACAPGPTAESAQTVIQGVDAWGSRITLTIGKCTYFTIVDGQGTWYWIPTIRTDRMLESVLRPTSGVIGKLREVGGPPPGLNNPEPGTVTVRNLAGEVVATVKVGADGTFSAHVPAGRYRIVGHSPNYQHGKYACVTEHPIVTVRTGRTTNVEVICEIP